MFMRKEKLWERTKELERRRYEPVSELFPMLLKKSDRSRDALHIDYPGKIEGTCIEKDDYFTGWDDYAWLQAVTVLPQARSGFTLWGIFDFGRTGEGFNAGFESLLFVDGERFQAVDTFHNDVPLDAFTGQEIELTFLLWTGLNGSSSHAQHHHRFAQAELCWLNTDCDQLYRYARGICEGIDVLPDTDMARDDLLHILDGAFHLVNWDTEKLYPSVSEALAYLKHRLSKLDKHSAITVYCAGHTHIDIAWLWRLKHTREKAVRSFVTADRLLHEFDDFVFLQSQPQLLRFIKKDAPELYEKIKAHVQSGRWEPEGAMWLEADCNISSGESLARQLLHGCRFLREEFGRESEYLWLPDVFGYSWALPQLLKLANIKTFMTTKISWNQYNRMPHDLFFWRGIDGSEVLTYFVTTPHPNRPQGDYRATYNGVITAETVTDAWRRFSDKGVSRDVLISYGHGDGGGGVTREMIHNARVLDALPGLPNVRLSGGGEFFRKLHENVKTAEEPVHIWDGELYLEYHRGTYTTQAQNKKWNRILESRLAMAEWLDAAAGLCGGTSHAAALHEGWECVLLHQFHDIIPGSSIHEVYEDSIQAYAQIAEQLDCIQKEQAKHLCCPNAQSYTLWSFSSFDRNDTVLLPEMREGTFTDQDGQQLQVQKRENGTLVQLHMSPLCHRSITFTPQKLPTTASEFMYDLDHMQLETPYYVLHWNSQGHLISLWHKTAQREVLAAAGNVLELYEDKPLQFDAWDIDLFHIEKMERLSAVSPPQLVESGPVCAVLRFAFATDHSVIHQDIIVYTASRRIDFVTTVDWHEEHRLLKAAFPLDIRTTKARYDIQFGYVERPTHWNTSWDQARFEVVGHKWAELSEHGYGVALLNDCKYGYSAYGNTLRITLLRSPKEPDAIADMGKHRFTYSLFPHSDDLKLVIAEAASLNQPVAVMEGQPKNIKELLKLEGNGVQVDAFKRAEDGSGYVLRVHEVLGGRLGARLRSDFAIKRYAPCNLLEDLTSTIIESDTICLQLNPFQIQNFRVWFD